MLAECGKVAWAMLALLRHELAAFRKMRLGGFKRPDSHRVERFIAIEPFIDTSRLLHIWNLWAV